MVSALVPYKRIDQAVAACTHLGRRLVVIGAGPERERLEKMAGATVRFLGWQPDEVIRDHYRRCRALLFPGEEDFGIVPVEALACGSPVIALGRGGAVETVDSTIGRLYDDPTVNALEATIAAWEAEGCPHDPVLARRRAERSRCHSSAAGFSTCWPRSPPATTRPPFRRGRTWICPGSKSTIGGLPDST